MQFIVNVDWDSHKRNVKLLRREKALSIFVSFPHWMGFKYLKSGNFIASNRGEKLNDKENEIIGNKKWNKALKVKKMD